MTLPAKRGRTRTRDTLSVTRTLDRGIHLLEILAERREATLTELARDADLSPSTALRLLETLRARRFVVQDSQSGIYVVGIRAFSVGAAAVRSGRLDRIALHAMRKLSQDTGETISLGIRETSHVVYVEQIEGSAAMRSSWRLGTRLPLHATAAGKVLLAWMWEAAIDGLLGPAPYARRTDHTLVERLALLDALAQVRRQGHARDDEECEVDLRCIAVPIRDRRGDVVAALSLSSSAQRLTDAGLPLMIRSLSEAASDISTRLGWQQTPAQPTPPDDEIFQD